MRTVFLFLLCLTLTWASSEAKTLRWGTKGDAQSMDPYAFNEGLTNNINWLLYDTLVQRDREQRIVPRLASSWMVVNDTTSRFTLRRDARFQDGTSVTAADVVFSIKRSQQPTSQFAVYTRRLGRASAIDDHTIELRLELPNPILLEHALNVFVMSRAWCTAHNVERVPNFTLKEEAYTTHNAMGSGPFILNQREPGVRTVLLRNPRWWGTFDGNVSEVATGPEDRVIFFGFDQCRDQLLYSNVKGRNPFKDRRVREAFFRAVDVEALRSRIMRGQSVPTYGSDRLHRQRAGSASARRR